ncbi:unnamed protein product [Caenorhabditis sp. 36 PRJEB53466]|nr:unnamed protein product [Caenorhabditis sp. 36 PRJEB53466]
MEPKNVVSAPPKNDKAKDGREVRFWFVLHSILFLAALVAILVHFNFHPFLVAVFSVYAFFLNAAAIGNLLPALAFIGFMALFQLIVGIFAFMFLPATFSSEVAYMKGLKCAFATAENATLQINSTVSENGNFDELFTDPCLIGVLVEAVTMIYILAITWQMVLVFEIMGSMLYGNELEPAKSSSSSTRSWFVTHSVFFVSALAVLNVYMEFNPIFIGLSLVYTIFLYAAAIKNVLFALSVIKKIAFVQFALGAYMLATYPIYVGSSIAYNTGVEFGMNAVAASNGTFSIDPVSLNHHVKWSTVEARNQAFFVAIEILAYVFVVILQFVFVGSVKDIVKDQKKGHNRTEQLA